MTISSKSKEYTPERFFLILKDFSVLKCNNQAISY